MSCRKNSPGNPCCVPLDPTCEEACATYADVVSKSVTVVGMSQDFVFDLFPSPEQPSCAFLGYDCYLEAIEQNSSMETTRDETSLVDNCVGYYSTCQDGFTFSYTQAALIQNVAMAVMQQDRFDIGLTLRPVTGSTTTLRFTATLGYQRYVQICGFISFEHAYRQVTATVNTGLANSCVFGAWTHVDAGTHPAFYLVRDPSKFQREFDECPFDWAYPTNECLFTYSSVGSFDGVVRDPPVTGDCSVSGSTAVFAIDPVWCDDWGPTIVGEFYDPPYACVYGGNPAATFLVGYREFWFEYESATFECDAFPANPIELKRMPYTDIAATDVAYDHNCSSVGETDMTLSVRVTTPAIPKSLYITI